MLQRVGGVALVVGFVAFSALSCSNDQAPVAPGDPGQTPQAEQLSVSMDVHRDSIAYGGQRQFSARVHNQFNVARVALVTWKSSNTEVMTVTSDGYASAVGAGTAMLIASIPNGAADSATISVYGVIETLSVIPEVVSIPEGDTIRFQANYGNVQGAEASYVSWSTSDPTIASVDASGQLAALKEGDVQLVARYGARSANAAVKVNRSQVSSVTISPSASTIQPGATVTLVATVQDALGHVLSDRNIVWSSSATDVATVDGNGVVTGVAKGYALIQAKSEGHRATASVTVGPRAVSSVSVSLDQSLLTIGQQTTAHATVYASDGSVIPPSEQPVAWQSSNPSIATVTATGAVTAIAAGSVKISAISGGQVGSAAASVQTGVANSIAISPSAPSVLQGAQIQLSAVVSDQAGAPVSGAVVSWASSNPQVATISTGGVATGVSVGTSTITATSGSLTATAVLTVTTVQVASVTVSPTSASLDVGGSATFVATPRDASGNPLTGRTVTWSSANPTVATVSSGGVVTALAQGSVVITATSDGKSGSAEVSVNAPAPTPVASIKVVLNSSTIDAGQSTQAVATLYDASGNVLTGRTVSWSSSAPEVATVSSSGLVTGIAAGSVTILATSGGQTGLATLTVNTGPIAPVATVLVTLSPTQIAQGGTSQAQVTLEDSAGNTLTGRTVGYASSNSSVATVSSSGMATGVGGGTAEIMAVSDGQSGEAPLQVGTTSGTTQPASLTINAPSTVLTTGQSEQLTTTIKDAGGNVLTGLTVTWETHDTSVITIDANGLVKAVGPGSATVYAWQSSTAWSQIGLTVQADTSTSSPTSAPVASVTVTLNSPSLAVGQSTQAVATMKDANGNVLSGRSVVWTSTNLAVATVTQSGVVTAVAAGTAQIQAVSEGISGMASLTVTSPGTPSGPPPAGSIALNVVRFDGGTGTVLVSNGIPLIAGALFPSQTDQLRMYVNGVEQSVHVEALQGLHPDGSLRSVLVQFYYNVPSGGVAGNLVLGQSRQTTDMPNPGNNRAVLTAAALPVDPNYLVATDLNGSTIPAAQSSALGGVWSRYESDFVKYSNWHWTTYGYDWGNTDYYDRALIYAAWYVRTGNPEYFRRAALIAVDYRAKYLEANNYNSSPHWAQLEGLEQNYLLTGDEKSRYAIARVGEVMNWSYDPKITDTSLMGWIENRIQTRILQSYFLAWRLNAVGDKSDHWATWLDDATTRVLSTQQADGSYRFQSTCMESLNYMTGLLNDQFIKMYTYYKPDSRLKTAIQRSAAFLWSTQWLPASQSFKYLSGNCNPNPSGMNVGGPNPSPDLSNLFTTTFSWLYQQTGNSAYRTEADSIFAGGVRQAYLTGTKQFNESYTSSFRYLKYRQ